MVVVGCWFWKTGFVASIALLLGGCRGCKGDHPYVPYAIDDDAAAGAADAAPAGDLDDSSSPAFAEEMASYAPAGATRWKLGALDLVAPETTVFELGISADLDGDGQQDAVAIARKDADPLDPGMVLFYKGGGLRTTLVPARASAKACPATRRLGLVGKRSVVVELGLGCPAASSREPSRYLAVLSFGRGPRVQLEAGVLDPPGAGKLSFEVDGSDRDGDGSEDVAFAATLEGGSAPFEPGPRLRAFVRWFDRPAGLSRDASEPDLSLRSVAFALGARASRPKDAPGVPPAVRQLRALLRALCSEGGSTRLVRLSPGSLAPGGPLVSCGASHAMEDAALAEVHAAVTAGEPVLAATLLDRAQRPPATKTVARAATALGWLEKLAPPSVATEGLRAVAAVPAFERGRMPSWGALAFETSGKLLVRTAAGVARVDPVTGDEADALDVRPWELGVTSPDGARRLLEAYDACDGVALHATLGPGTVQDLVDVALPIAPPLGASRCAGAKGEPVPATALAWGPGGLEAVLAGEPTLVTDAGRASALHALLGQPYTLGAPRSPDGKTVVVPAGSGLVVWGPRNRLLRAKELDGAYADQRDCAISDDATRAACVRAGRVWVGVFP